MSQRTGQTSRRELIKSAGAVAALAAMKKGKHVYCEKPLAHSVGEIRALMKAAQEHKVVTQMGIIALKMPGTKLQWDGPNMRFTNSDEANKYLTPTYRPGWSL